MSAEPLLQEVTTRFGQRMYVDASDLIGRTIIREGIFDLPGLIFLSSLLRRLNARHVLDVGGNIGNHALVFSRYAEKVWSFEPNPTAWRILEKNIQANAMENIHLCRFGLSDADVNADMFVNRSGNLGGSTLRAASRLQDSEYVAETVPLRRGDAWVAEHIKGAIDFIKLDIEGHEEAALTGLRETVLTHRPVIIMEWNEISDRDGVCGSAVFKEISRTYTVFGLYKASDKKYWKHRPFGAIRRLYTKIRKGKALTLMPLIEREKYPGMNIRDLLLVPNEKRDLLE